MFSLYLLWQINGEFEAVQEALLQITTRLRHHFFRDVFPSINSSNPAFVDQVHPFPSYMGRRELSPPGMYPNLGPSFHKFDAVGGPPPHGGFHLHDDRSSFMHNVHRLGAPPYMSDRKPWGPQVLDFYDDVFSVLKSCLWYSMCTSLIFFWY